MNHAPPQPVRRIVIAGGGTAGWITAAALAKTLGRLYEIRLVESEEIGTIGVGEATIPTMLFLHEILGIDEREFMAATNATFKLGIRFENWRNVGEHYFHSFGKTGKPHWTAGFQHFWLEARRRGLPVHDYGDYCLELRAALDNRFGHLKDTVVNYAFHLDATAYAGYLRRIAEAHGVQRIEGKIAKVDGDPDTGIRALTLADGSRLEGDFFVDCTGMRSLLLGETLGVGYQSWAQWLPCDSAVAAQTTSVGEAVPYTRSIAHPWGWQWRIPLQHRVGNGLVYSSRHLGDDEAKATLLANVQGEVLRPPRVIKFTPGQREIVWKHNCVAIGLSSGFLEPLESTSIHLIQRGVTRLIQMFPTDGVRQSDIDEYNAQTTWSIERIRDFIILHYHVTKRDDSPLWRACREMPVPELLAHRIRLFRETARVCLNPDELFAENSWIQVMMGQGLVPQAHHPVSRLMDDAMLGEFLGEIRKEAARTLVKLPRHDAYVRRYSGRGDAAPEGAPALLLNPQATAQTVTLADGNTVLVVDDFLQQPQALRALAESMAGQFQRPGRHPYPGPQLDLPASLCDALGAFFQRHAGPRLAAGPMLAHYARFARVTQDPSTLDPRQRICHRDDSDLGPGDSMTAMVHYLFDDAALGGTVFFRSRLAPDETRQLLQDSGTLDDAAFTAKHGLAPGYMTQDNRCFEVIGRIPARFNRAIFYDGSIFHSGDIDGRLGAAYQAWPGRLTVNGFFKCRQVATAPALAPAAA